MSATRPMVENVRQFMNKASQQVGLIAAETWECEHCLTCLSVSDSPIEQLFYLACAAHCAAWSIPLSWSLESTRPHGMRIQPQAQIGKYRVDFLLSFRTSPEEFSSVIVELDGHEFHDKDKAQRAYEKARDRFIVKKGYRVLHFTGSEVVADPFRVAHEAMHLVGAFQSTWDEYESDDPLGMGCVL